MRTALMLALVLMASPVLAADTFSDVPKSHWAYEAIQAAVDAGILQGYDGKFHGQRLLNRYQMAVVVDKLLKAVKGNPMAAKADGGKTVANLEALTIEFADELALLNVKVSTLEDGYTELKKQVEGFKGGSGVSAGGLGFTAFASFGLISTDDGPDAVITPPATGSSQLMTRYGNYDSLFFTLPQVSIGVDKEVNEGVYFHAQFDYTSEVNATSSGMVGVNEAYFLVDELLGDIGAKVGAFALPFNQEQNGPFRSYNLTITPSAMGTFVESFRCYGLEFQKVKDVNPEDIFFKVGIVSGTDMAGLGSMAGNHPFAFNDAPVVINQGENDDGFGYYLQVGKKVVDKKGFGWNLGYFTNGGDPNTIDPLKTASPDIDFWQLGFEWWGEKFGVMGAYHDGEIDMGGMNTADYTTWYLLLNFIIDEKNNVTLRYDDWELDTGASSDPEGNGWVLAFNHKVTENSMFQFEYLTSDEDWTAVQDINDDLIQLRYKVHF